MKRHSISQLRSYTMTMRLRTWLLMALLAFPLMLAGHYSGAGEKKKDDPKKDDPKYANFTYVPTADEVIYKMFDMAKVNKNDVIFDLGCGDNRILYMAAKKFGCRGVGIDLNPERIKESMDQYVKFNKDNAIGTLVEVRHGDALKVKDIGDASVVVMYMFPEFMDLWQPIALKHLKPGTRIVSHDYSWHNDKPGVVAWEPDETVKVRSATREHTVHMWTVKERKKGE